MQISLEEYGRKFDAIFDKGDRPPLSPVCTPLEVCGITREQIEELAILSRDLPKDINVSPDGIEYFIVRAYDRDMDEVQVNVPLNTEMGIDALTKTPLWSVEDEPERYQRPPSCS